MESFTIANPAGLHATAPPVAGENIFFEVAVPGFANQEWNFIGGLPGTGPIENVGTGTFAVLGPGGIAPGTDVFTAAAPIPWTTVPLGGGEFNILPAPGAAVAWGDGGIPAHDVLLAAPPAALTVAVA